MADATEELQELYAFLKVTNMKDAKQSITGLRERILFTRDCETIRTRLQEYDEQAASENMRNAEKVK